MKIKILIPVYNDWQSVFRLLENINSEVLNLDRQTTVELQSGSDCQLVPIVVNGKVVDVIIQKAGSRYLSIPDLIVEGDGVGAVLTPVLENGSVTDVKIIAVSYTHLRAHET